MFLPSGQKRALSEGKIKSRAEQSMSGYRASLSTGTRAGGQSASAKHKYQNRQDIYLVGREGVRDDLVASGSGNLPAFADGDAGKYWLAADSFERKNARLFVELQLNLPRELSLEQQKEAVKNYMSDLCDKEKLSYSWVIHHGKGENPHAHVMISETKNDAIDRPAEQHFKRFNRKYPERGGAQKSSALKPKQWLLDARGAWAMTANDALEKAGFKRHFDHRTLKEQRVSALLAKDWRKAAELDREVGEHEGWRVAALRRKHEVGELDVLPEYARKVIEKNDRIKELNAAHLSMVAGMSDAQLKRWEREAYFDALAEREPERFKAEIELLHSEALVLDGQLEPEPEPPAPQAAQDADADFLEDEDMTTQETFKQKQLAALAAMRAEKAAHLELVQSEPAAELEAEPAAKLRLVQPDERAAEPEAEAVPEVTAEQQASRLDQLRAELEAQEAELEALAAQVQDADRFAAEQAQKAGELEQQYKESMRQQKELEAQADALEPTGFQALVAFVARALGYRTQSDKLREQAQRLAGQRFEQQRGQLLDARAQAESAKAESAEARQDLLDGKTQRAGLVDAVMLEKGTGSLKKAVAREVQKLERLESDFEKLGSSKAFELQKQREAITQVAEPSDKQLLQQAKALRELAQGAAYDYRTERLEASRQAQKGAQAAYYDALESLKDCGFDDDYKQDVRAQLDADRSAYFELMKDPSKRSDPQLFKELEGDTQALTEMVREHMQKREQLEQQRQLDQQQRQVQPRQRQDHKSDFGL